MLSVELQPAVRQIVERNEQLEEENKCLLDKIHELLTEVTSLKAARHKFKLDCESMVATHASELMSPTREMKQKLKRQRRQIENLQNQLTSTKTELETIAQEKNAIQKTYENHADTLEKAAQDEADATNSCCEMAQSINNLIGIIAKCNGNNANVDLNEKISINDLPTAVSFLQKKILLLSENCTEMSRSNDELTLESANHKQHISTLETQIQCLQKEKETLEECNQKYINEREELGSAISTLRSALMEVKNNLITSDEEKKELKNENIRLRIELDSYKDRQKSSGIYDDFD